MRALFFVLTVIVVELGCMCACHAHNRVPKPPTCTTIYYLGGSTTTCR